MVSDELHSVLLIVAVDLHVRGFDELAEHVRREEGRYLGAPVVMMEQTIRLHVFAHLGCVVQFELSDAVDQFVHLVGILVEGEQTVLDLQQIVALFENAGSKERHDELLVPVDLLSRFDEGFPLFGIIYHPRDLYVVLPVLDVLDHDLVGGVHGEGTGSPDGP